MHAAARCVKEMFGERRRRSQGLYYSDFRYVTICQRSSSGRWAKDGIPLRNEPLRSIQNSLPGSARRTWGLASGGAFPIPVASRP
jgi:hypothetical protein